ncbi:MAG: hypothetical protein MUO52_04860 [Desulfobacterales bacterium]|nr:hypothetical protein [Desulfobacterales bacterium]
MLKKLIFLAISVKIAPIKTRGVSSMQVKERLIKAIEEMPPEDVMNVYELVLDLKKQKSAPSPGKKQAYLEVQEILEKCTGSLSDDISLMREDRL